MKLNFNSWMGRSSWGDWWQVRTRWNVLGGFIHAVPNTYRHDDERVFVSGSVRRDLKWAGMFSRVTSTKVNRWMDGRRYEKRGEKINLTFHRNKVPIYVASRGSHGMNDCLLQV